MRFNRVQYLHAGDMMKHPANSVLPAEILPLCRSASLCDTGHFLLPGFSFHDPQCRATVCCCPVFHSGLRQRGGGGHFTGISPAFHHAVMSRCQCVAAMKQNTATAKNEGIVIPIKIERVKLWSRLALEATTWLIPLCLLGAGASVSGAAALVWVITGSETILTLGFVGGLLLGLAGVWHLLHKLDRLVNELRPAGAARSSAPS